MPSLRPSGEHEVAASATQARHGAVTVANRLQRLEADRRRAIRARDGYSRTVYRGQGGAPDPQGAGRQPRGTPVHPVVGTSATG